MGIKSFWNGMVAREKALSGVASVLAIAVTVTGIILKGNSDDLTDVKNDLKQTQSQLQVSSQALTNANAILTSVKNVVSVTVNNEIPGAVQSIKSDKTSLTDTNQTLEAYNKELEAKVLSLQQATSTATEPGAPKVRVRRSLTVAGGNFFNKADLDATDPDWGTTKATGDARTEGPYLSGSSIYNDTASAFACAGEKPPTFATCTRAFTESYKYNSFEIGDLDPGSTFCLKTSAGRVAALTVMKEPTPNLLVFNVVVWQKAV